MSSDSPDVRDPAFANAYAISYRLLGDRSLASDVAERVAIEVSTSEDHSGMSDPILDEIAGAAVDGALEMASEHSAELDAVTHRAARGALRRRFAAATSTQRRAAALVHLGGYERDEVAELLVARPEQVNEWCEPFEPPTGRSWAELGDPELTARRVVQPERNGLRRVPLFYWFLAAAVLALGLWAATSVGKRPSIESVPDGQGSEGAPAGTEHSVASAPVSLPEGVTTVPDDAGTSFSAAAPDLPSAGCTAGDGDPEPAPLLVLVGDAQTSPDDVEDASGLFDLTEGWVHVPVLAEDIDQDGSNGMLNLLETTIKSNCLDLNRTFVVGFGEGGRVAGEAACAAPQLVTGIVMVAGWSEPGCSPSPRVAVLLVGSQDDPQADVGTALEELGSQWAKALGAGPMTVDGRDEETLVRRWIGPGDVSVETVATVTGGHAWTPAASLAVGPFLKTTGRSLG